MKPDQKLRKALLTDEEIQLLLDHYDRIIEDGTKMLKTLTGKPIEGLIANQVAEIQCRRATIAKFVDGRWTNRGKGRPKSKETALPDGTVVGEVITQKVVPSQVI